MARALSRFEQAWRDRRPGAVQAEPEPPPVAKKSGKAKDPDPVPAAKVEATEPAKVVAPVVQAATNTPATLNAPAATGKAKEAK